MSDKGFSYEASETGIAFHNSDAYVKMITGPFGSGKSCICAMDCLLNAMAQPPADNGVRYSRIGVIRSTYPELVSTTRNSLLEVFPSEYGSINLSAPPRGTYKFPLPDGTSCQVELVLQALQTPEDAEKVKSANWTFAWINEATGVSPDIFNTITGRVTRYPSDALGGCRWGGIIMDFNQPPQGHYLLEMMKNPEDNWEVFKQPPAAFKTESDTGIITYTVNPRAENLVNLGSKRLDTDDPDIPLTIEEKKERGLSYYANQIASWQKTGQQDKVDSLFCMLDVPMKDGKPVFPSFSSELHVARLPIEPISLNEVVIGYDTSGVHPAVVIGQQIQGKWCVIDEIIGEGMGLEAFVEGLLVPLVRTKYNKCNIVVSCDPANAKDAYTGLAPTTHLKNFGFTTSLPRTNNPKTRIQAVEQILNKNVGGLLVSPTCKNLIRALGGAYRYKKLRVSGSIDVAYDSKPEKNDASHIADALQYMCLHIIQGSANKSIDKERPMHWAKNRNRMRRMI